MEIRQLNCPNCGAQVNSSHTKELECSYCGSKFKNPLYEEKPVKEKRGIEERDFRIPFLSSQEDVKKALYNKFISNDEVPLDIFDKLEIVSMKQYYIPMYYFSGRYDAPWSCTKVIKRKDNHGNEYTDYQPASGLTRGNFSKLVLASKALGLPSDLMKYAHVLSLTPGLNSRKSSIGQSIGTDIEVLSIDRTLDECWNDGFFHDRINSNARGAAWDDAIGWRAENFTCSTSFVCDSSELLYIPIWFGQYSYKGQEYYFAMDDKLGNIDFAYSRDNTNEKRKTRIWLRDIFTWIVLAAICIYTECLPASFVAFLGAVFLFFRTAFELSKSSDDLSSIKKVGKAKLCNEEIPEASTDYTRYKKTNHIMMWALIALVAIWGFGTMALREQKERNEQARIAQEEFQKQQAEERLQQEVNEKREKQNRRKEAVLDMISPQKLIKVNNNGSYQLREDLAQVLLKLGFEKDDSDDGRVLTTGETTTYKFNVDDIYDDGTVSNFRFMTAYINEYQSSFDSQNKHKSVLFLGYFKGIIDRLIQQLKQDGYKVTKVLQIGDNISYSCLKETDFELESDDNIIIMKNNISFKLSNSQISVSVSQEPF